MLDLNEHTNIFTVLEINNSTILKRFTLETIESIFEKIGGLQKNSFNVSKYEFADGSFNLVFHYPTDMNSQTATEFIDTLLEKMKDLTLEEFNYILINKKGEENG